MTPSSRKFQVKNAARRFTLWLASIVLLLDLFVIFLAFLSLREARLQYQERAAAQTQNLCQALMSGMAGIMDTTDVGLLSVVDEAEREAAHGGIDREGINRYIARQFRRTPEVMAMRMADARGNILFGTGTGGGVRKSVADREYFKRLRDDPAAGLVVSKPVLGRLSGRWVLIVARRINAPDGSFGGVAYASISLQRLRGVLASIDVGHRGRITLRDRDMLGIVQTPESEPEGKFIGRDPCSPEIRKRLAAGQTSGTFFAPPGAGQGARILSYRRIGSYPLYLTVNIAESDYLIPWWRELHRLSALVSLFIAVTLVLSRLIFIRWRREKEADALLFKSHEELELRVAERTEELSLANSRLNVELAERQLAEEQLRQGRNMLAHIVNAIPQAVFWKDRDSVFLGCNAVFARAAGVAAPDEIVGRNDLEMFDPEEARAYRNDDREVMEGNRAKYHIVEQVRHADGGKIWVDTTKIPLCNRQGEVYGVLGVFENITEKKAVEEARDNALALFETLLTSSPTGIQVFDGESGDCVTANESLAAMVGGARPALLSQNFRTLRSWLDSGAHLIGEEVLADSATRHVEMPFVTTFGRSVYFDCFFCRCDVDGKPHLLFIALDITENKRLEAENKRIEAQMLHVQKLESLGVLAGGIAHDFNNILMVVLGNADLALMRLGAESTVRENLLQIEHAASRAADLARQMLAYSGKGRFVIENLDLTKIVREMAQMLEVSISKKVLLRYSFAPDLPAISGDATQLRQVILNLVINASEAIGDENGAITVKTSAMQCDRSYLSESWIDDGLPEGTYVVLEVADTGCGIDREIIPKIFDPFFTTKFTGRGLGMAAVLGIVRGHQGAIKIYSEKGKGTTFKLLLPALAEEVARQLPAKPEKLWQGSGTVLLVDDEATIRALGQDMLEELGFAVLAAADGRSAIELFKRHRGEIACVLLDLTMPELDGEQTFHELRRLEPAVKVVISSGYNEQEVSQKFVGRGLAGFLQKPYKLSEMSGKLKEILG